MTVILTYVSCRQGSRELKKVIMQKKVRLS
jgi:hypothetical protein